MRTWFASLLLVSSLTAVSGQTCVNISTGFDQVAGVPLLPGDADDDFIVDLADGSLGAPPAYVVEEDGFPIPPWFANSAKSMWIGFNAPDSNSVPGTYYYEIHVFLAPEVEAEKAVLIGKWGTDDGGPGFEINGTFIASPSNGFGALATFPANTGLGLFVSGDNVIRFQVDNGGVDLNPTGLRVEGCVGVPSAERRAFDLSTGFEEGNGFLLADNADDDDYKITGPAGSGISNAAATCVLDDDFPIPPWALNTANARWIGTNAADSVGPGGEYRYKVVVILPAGFGDAKRGVLSGAAAADDSISDVLVNGASIGFTALDAAVPTIFPVDAGYGLFKTGINSVEFVVQNSADGSTGLFVDGEVILGPEIPNPAVAELTIDTGFDDIGGQTILNGGVDDSYVILGPPGSHVGPALASIVTDNAFPIPPWLPTTDLSKWVSGQADSNGPAGNYFYKVTVDIPDAYDATQARLVGWWATDDPGIDIIINGNSTGQGAGGFAGPTYFPPGLGLGLFQTGENQLQFVVQNGGGPTGLRVEGVVGFEDAQALHLNTGSDPRGIGLIAEGTADTRWRVTGPDGSDIAYRKATVLPASAGGAQNWVANNATAQWVGVQDGPAGDYTYTIKFPVSSGANPYRLAIQGKWAAAGSGKDVLLNGTSLALSAGGPSAFTDFPAGAGSGLFVAGTNTLQFVVTNAASGPTGLRVEATLAEIVEANPFDISTGFDQVAGAVIVPGDQDPDYSVTDPQQIADLASVLIGAPIPPWIANSGTSAWVGSGAGVSLAPGQYMYEVLVDIPTDALAAQAAIKGGWATDDHGDDVIINGTSTGAQNNGGFGGLTLFPPDLGLGLFARGANSIQFLVSNGGADINPTGLRVDAVILPPATTPAGPRFVRGDANSDRVINLTDAVFILNYLFGGGATPSCMDAADVDDSGGEQPAITDAIRLLGWLFLGGQAPAVPTPQAASYGAEDCGEDPTTDDNMSCASFGACA